MPGAGLSVATLLLLLGAALLTAGCGGSGSKKAETESTAVSDTDAATAGKAPCSTDGSSKPLPAGFPTDLPLPKGTIVRSTGKEGAFAVVHAVAPGDLKQTVKFVQTSLPKSGYMLGGGDAEADEADTEFSSSAWTGRMKIHAIENCDSAVTLDIAAKRLS